MALAGGGPQNVAVLVNSNDPDSLAVANCYVELRQIPATNVIYVPWELDARATTAVKFRDQLMKPALAELEKRGVLPQIDCIAFSSGFPYLVDCARLWPSEAFPQDVAADDVAHVGGVSLPISGRGAKGDVSRQRQSLLRADGERENDVASLSGDARLGAERRRRLTAA